MVFHICFRKLCCLLTTMVVVVAMTVFSTLGFLQLRTSDVSTFPQLSILTDVKPKPNKLAPDFHDSFVTVAPLNLFDKHLGPVSLDENPGRFSDMSLSTTQSVKSFHTTTAQPAAHLEGPSITNPIPSSKSATVHGRSIFFLKTHKTGGSAIQNIVLRQALLKNLSVGLSDSGSDWSRLCIEKLFEQKCLCNNEEVPVDAIAHHMVFSKAQVLASLKTGAKFVSILRDPVDVIRSAYTFFSWDAKFGSFDGFLNKMFASDKVSSLLVPYRNLMMYVFGLRTYEFDREARVKRKLEEIESTFDLVMINEGEKFSQSLVLLRELMGWSLDDVVVLHINKQMHSRPQTTVSEAQRNKVLQANRADHQLYEKFASIFDSKVRAYGEERMKEEVRLLKERTNQFRRLCVNGSTVNVHGIIEYRLTAVGKDNTTCRYLTAPEMNLTSLLIHRHNNLNPSRHHCMGGLM